MRVSESDSPLRRIEERYRGRAIGRPDQHIFHSSDSYMFTKVEGLDLSNLLDADITSRVAIEFVGHLGSAIGPPLWGFWAPIPGNILQGPADWYRGPQWPVLGLLACEDV